MEIKVNEIEEGSRCKSILILGTNFSSLKVLCL